MTQQFEMSDIGIFILFHRNGIWDKSTRIASSSGNICLRHIEKVSVCSTTKQLHISGNKPQTNCI